MERLKAMEEMLEYFETDQLLEAVIRALSDDEAMDIFNFIARMHEIDIK